ncbi:MAG: hypothetical protein WCJ30_10440 [Deltaproteobacteria bacterium]
MTRAALALACALAALLYFRAPTRGRCDVARALAALCALDFARPLLAPWPALYVACFVAWYAVTAAVCEAVLAPREPRTSLIFAVLACSSGTAIRLGATGELARASFALALASQALAAGSFLSRGHRPDDAQRVALILAASSLADAFGPWMLGAPSKDWHVGEWPAVITWIVVAAWGVRCLTRARTDRG